MACPYQHGLGGSLIHLTPLEGQESTIPKSVTCQERYTFPGLHGKPRMLRLLGSGLINLLVTGPDDTNHERRRSLLVDRFYSWMFVRHEV